MKKVLFLSLILFLAFSCKKDEGDSSIKKESGIIWLSGGLAHCAEQIHLDNGDRLIVNIEDVISYTSGDRVIVKYKEKGINQYCSPGIDCDVLEIRKE